MKLLVDMNLSPRWILLREAGWDAADWSALGTADASDSEIMAFAATNDYVVLTNDLDFAAISLLLMKKAQRGADSCRRPSP